jgi:MFS family permease
MEAPVHASLGRSQADYPGKAYAAYVVATLFLAWLMSYADRQIIGLLVPSLKQSLHLSDTQVSLLQGMAFALVYAFAGLPLGRLADRTVRRNLIAGGLAVWSLATIACGLATSFWHLFAARMCVGLGEACLAPAVASMVADYFRPHHRARALGFIQIGAPIGSSLALSLGGVLLTSLTAGALATALPAGWAAWQVVFIAAGAPGLVVAALVLLLREPPRRQPVVSLPHQAVGGPTLTGLLKAQPKTFAVIFSLYAALFIIGYGLTSWAPTLLMRVYGLSPRAAGGSYALVMLTCSVTGYLLSGFISDALRRKRPLDGRMLIPVFTLPIELVTMATFGLTDHVWVTIAMLAVSGVTLGISSTTAIAVLQDVAPGRLRGQVIAVYLLVANFVGLGLAPTLVGLVTDRVFRDEMMLQKAMGSVAFAAAAVAFLLALQAPRLYRRARETQVKLDAAVG